MSKDLLHGGNQVLDFAQAKRRCSAVEKLGVSALPKQSVFIENRISILKSKKEQIRGQIIFEISKEIIGLSNLGKNVLINIKTTISPQGGKRFKQKD